MKIVIAIAVAIGSVIVSCKAEAHEFWIRPDRYAAESGERVGLALLVGTGFPGERFARQSRRIVRFSLVDAGGERALEGENNDDPAGRVSVGPAGAAWAVYRSNAASVRLDATTFEKYLQEEGLDAIAALRARRGASAAPASEHYSRCAKALLTVDSGAGAAGGVVLDAPLGLTLELVPVRDPRRVGIDGRLDLLLLFRQRPLAGTLVKAMRENEPGRWHAARTDAEGRASLELPKGDAVWLVSAVHMTPAPPRSGADWESTWSSLTFETRPGSDRPVLR